MVCELLDFRCWIVNEIVGSTVLAVILAAIIYFIVAGRLRLGFDTTIAFALPTLLIFGIAFTGFSVIYAFATIVVGFMLAWIFDKIIKNR